MDSRHIVAELFDSMTIIGAHAFTLNNLNTGEEIKVHELVDFEIDNDNNIIDIFFGTKTSTDPSKIKCQKIGQYRFKLNNLDYLYFNYKGQRFKETDLGLIESYIYSHGQAAGRDEIREIFLSDKYKGDPIIKITMDYPF